jgi:hypothetical protein
MALRPYRHTERTIVPHGTGSMCGISLRSAGRQGYRVEVAWSPIRGVILSLGEQGGADMPAFPSAFERCDPKGHGQGFSGHYGAGRHAYG